MRLKRPFQDIPNETLIGNAPPRGGLLHRLEQRRRHPHVDALALGLEFESDALSARKIVFGQVGLGDEFLRRLIASEPRQFLFHSGSPRACAYSGR